MSALTLPCAFVFWGILVLSESWQVTNYEVRTNSGFTFLVAAVCTRILIGNGNVNVTHEERKE